MSEDLKNFLVSASRGGGRNFRSLGNCTTLEGRRVRAGRVFRSGHLGELASELRSEIDGLGLKTVITFQTRQEIDILGDPLPSLLPSILWEHIPIGDRWFEGGTSFPQDVVSQGEFYVKMVRDHDDLWARFFRVFTRTDRFSVLYHCTAGRDRTGVATVLLLESLRVPRPVIVEDYLLSNQVFESNLQEAQVLDPLFRMIDAEGGIDSFLVRLGLTAAEVEAVRRNLLDRLDHD
ncbi:MAG: tyrosine-protein phosphatase [Candidatus Binatia bacterium]